MFETSPTIVSPTRIDFDPQIHSFNALVDQLDNIDYKPRIHAITITTGQHVAGRIVDALCEYLANKYEAFNILSTATVKLNANQIQELVTFTIGKKKRTY